MSPSLIACSSSAASPRSRMSYSRISQKTRNKSRRCIFLTFMIFSAISRANPSTGCVIVGNSQVNVHMHVPGSRCSAGISAALITLSTDWLTSAGACVIVAVVDIGVELAAGVDVFAIDKTCKCYRNK